MTEHRSRLVLRTTPPATEPVSLAEAKLFLRVDNTDEDTLITELITVARRAAEEYIGKSLITQSWKIAYDEYVDECVNLPHGPVQSITSVKRFDRDDTETTIASSVYYLTAKKNMLIFDTAQLGHRIEIIYQAGYSNASDVPEPIKQGILSHIAGMYDGREEAATMAAAAITLYQPYREVRL
jgi:uncharacterized phiE125 gp8 family phage protein